MPLNLKASTIAEKNRLTSENPWPILIEIAMSPDDHPEDVLRLADNNEDVSYRGNTYLAFRFGLDVLESLTKGELPQIALRVSNVERLVQAAIEVFNGGVNAIVKIMAVSLADLDGDPSLETEFVIMSVTASAEWVTFGLGAENPMRQLFPRSRYESFHCRHQYQTPQMQAALDVRGIACGYEGSMPTCSRTLHGPNGCIAHNNVINFGGFPAIDSQGFRVASAV